MKYRFLSLVSILIVGITLVSNIGAAKEPVQEHASRSIIKIERTELKNCRGHDRDKVSSEFVRRLVNIIEYIKRDKNQDLFELEVLNQSIDACIVTVDKFIDTQTGQVLDDIYQNERAWTEPGLFQLKKEFWTTNVFDHSRNNDLIGHELFRSVPDKLYDDSSYKYSRTLLKLQLWDGQFVSEKINGVQECIFVGLDDRSQVSEIYLKQERKSLHLSQSEYHHNDLIARSHIENDCYFKHKCEVKKVTNPGSEYCGSHNEYHIVVNGISMQSWKTKHTCEYAGKKLFFGNEDPQEAILDDLAYYKKFGIENCPDQIRLEDL